MAERSPAAWLEVLNHRLDERWNTWGVFDNYYEGDQRVAAWLGNARAAFRGTVLGNLLNGLQDNYMPLVVDTAAERMRVQGFRVSGSKDVDPDAERIWKANRLKGQSNMVHTEAIKLGEAYWMVQPPRNGENLPRITAEHPSQVIVATDPSDRSQRLAALKRWKGDDGWIYANVYLPNRVVKYRTKGQSNRIIDLMPDQLETKWETVGAAFNPLGVVPIIPVPNNPSMLHGGRSDLSFGAIALQDQILKTIADTLIGSEYQGLPQRVLMGVEPPRDPNTGRPIPFEQAAQSRLWYFPSKDAKAHEFSQADLKALREMTEGMIGDLAAQTRIPIYYFRPQAISNISAEALIGLDAGLVSKCRDKEDPFGEGHDGMMDLALRAMGKEASVETIWANTESRSQAQVVDAATKKVSIGVPWEQAMEDIGYTPEQIDRMAAMREADSLFNEVAPDATQPPVPPAN